MIDWAAFLVVAAAALVSSAIVVSLYSLGLRLLTTAGRIPMVEPAEFTGAITVLSPARAAKDAKRARKARKANPLTANQKSLAQYAGYLCFGVCGLIVLYGVYLIVPALHK